MKNQKTLYLVQGAAIAAIYVVITMIFAPISFGNVQICFAEALTILPFFTPAAVPGLFAGCFIANILGGAIPMDIICGSLATLIGAVLSYRLRNHKYLVPVPPIAANVLIVPFVLYYGYSVNLPIPFMMFTVGMGEVISCGILGMIILLALERYQRVIFQNAAA